jgi:riboflavin synthase
MFTGIVQTVGRITHIQSLGPEPAGFRLTVYAKGLDLKSLRLGDSIAIQGACMTAMAIDVAQAQFQVEVSRESLSKTVGLDQLGEVNLETALALSTPLGGHLVSGHVDGLGVVENFSEINESWLLQVAVPDHLRRFFAYKGSATVNGVSLTINKVQDRPNDSLIDINLIPHTIQNTSLKLLKTGQLVNLEVDLIARYCERLLQFQGQIQNDKS